MLQEIGGLPLRAKRSHVICGSTFLREAFFFYGWVGIYYWLYIIVHEQSAIRGGRRAAGCSEEEGCFLLPRFQKKITRAKRHTDKLTANMHAISLLSKIEQYSSCLSGRSSSRLYHPLMRYFWFMISEFAHHHRQRLAFVKGISNHVPHRNIQDHSSC